MTEITYADRSAGGNRMGLRLSVSLDDKARELLSAEQLEALQTGVAQVQAAVHVLERERLDRLQRNLSARGWRRPPNIDDYQI